ncbi:ribosomal protein L6 [Desulfurobacterium thermolithotrophum DSM 11699]|uniref:Large ribosomal subunit protein uL6 n=1 Tax=Desulfurobacterium thermolithotrophum (strain DSM 11699 / BSA) TaxID=868864 RepID=F0S1D5_DESTD|nr:50S ribosomal protein L6 [Desulfurobacterium thermolithotrophum]ADY72866.1 ribosomal protein L6 [Desulfurobacterium thermolithotrophum DSM 11699]
MSRIGRMPIEIPQGVTVEVKPGNHVVVKGPKGTLEYTFNPRLTIKVEDNKVIVERPTDEKQMRALHGTTRALINNMVIGVSKGFEKVLEVKGLGYRAFAKGKVLELHLGFSHPVLYQIPEGIEIEVDRDNNIYVRGIDKQKVGQVAAEIRSFRPPEPYKGKGIRYRGEKIVLKAGKSAKK